MDVLEQGREPAPRRRWPLLIGAGAVLLAGGAYVVHARSGGPAARSAAPTATAAASGGAASAGGAAGPSAAVTTTGPAWPEAAAACSGTLEVPRVSAPPLDRPTGLHLAVASGSLRVVDVDRGAVRAVAGLAPADGRLTTGLVQGPDGLWALAQRCTVVTDFSQELLRVDRPLRTARAARDRVDAVVVGPGGTWSVTWPTDEPGPAVVRRRPAGRPSLTAPAQFDPVASTPGGFIGTLSDGASDEPGRVALWRRGDARATTVARGDLLGVRGDDLLVATPCAPGEQPEVACRLRWGPPGGPLREVVLPAGRSTTSAAVISPDGTRAAVQLARTTADPAAGHPGPPSDVAVLDLRTGAVQVLAGAELPPKYAAGLAFSPDGRWLVVALAEGGRTWLLAWSAELPGPARLRLLGVRLPGSTLYGAAVVALPGPAGSPTAP